MGPGLLESVYEECLLKELKLRNIQATNQVELPLIYKGKKLKKEFRIDVLVEALKKADGMIAKQKDHKSMIEQIK